MLSVLVEDVVARSGQDLLTTVRLPTGTLIAIADGAGGVAGGTEAARRVCAAAEELNRPLLRTGEWKSESWVVWLSTCDRSMMSGLGLAAAVVVMVSDDGGVIGVSVGDCGAWLFEDGVATDLTSGQHRKPLLGEGRAVPVPFEARLEGGTLVVATDGLWKYMKPGLIAQISGAGDRSSDEVVRSLVDGVKLANGKLQDDVAVAVYRRG